MNKYAVKICHYISEKLRSNNIDVWLEYGSALGAIRDGGIPEGDDDIDMGVWEKDWSSLESVIKEGLPYSYKYNFIKCFSGGKILHIANKENEEQFKIDIWCFNTNDNHGWGGIGIRSGPSNYKRAFRSKAYYQQNLKTIQFEGFEFLVSKYAEKYLDYLYKDTGGMGIDWRTTVVKSDEVSCWEGGLKSYSYRDSITGCAEGVFDLYHKGHVRLFRRMKDVFDHVFVAILPDDAVETYKPTPVFNFDERVEMIESCKYVDKVILPAKGYTTTIDWMEANNIDYMVHGNAEESFLKYWYSEAMEEHRLFLLDETKDYHSQDIKRKIQNV
jgi:cytidyltransferase-like protein